MPISTSYSAADRAVRHASITDSRHLHAAVANTNSPLAIASSYTRCRKLLRYAHSGGACFSLSVGQARVPPHGTTRMAADCCLNHCAPRSLSAVLALRLIGLGTKPGLPMYSRDAP